MQNLSFYNFLFISIPEEFLIVLFSAALLGRKEVFRLSTLIVTTIITAVTFETERVLLYNNNQILCVIVQLISLIFILYLWFKISYVESLIVSLLALIIVSTVLAAIVAVGMVIIKNVFSSYSSALWVKIIIMIPELATISLISLTVYKKNIIRINLRVKELNMFQERKVRFAVLVLTFTFFITIVNYKIFLKYLSVFTSSYDKLLLLTSIAATIIFAAAIIIYSLKLIKNIQNEEKVKRESIDKEYAQNILYMCKLLEGKELDEVGNILHSLKRDSLKKLDMYS